MSEYSRQAAAPLWRGRLTRWGGMAFSAAMVVALVLALRQLDWRELLLSAPHDPLFWLAFTASYLLVPVFEWLIYRRLWGMPPGGIVALLRKQISNELLLGYSGDAQLYFWARRNESGRGSADAVKDVAMLSAAAGAIATLAMMAAVAPALWATLHGPLLRALAISVGFATLVSLTMLVFRRALFSLSRRELWRIFALHMLRIACSVVLLAAMWKMLIPGTTLQWLLLLATLRQMLSRLPLLPNKDALFAGAVLLALGTSSGTTKAIALVTALTIAAHAILLPLVYIHGRRRRAQAAIGE